MKKTPVWIDCDAGIDDYTAIMLAHALKEIEILGISVLYGKSGLGKAYKNALSAVRSLGGDYPVYCGAEKPLINAAVFDGSALPLTEEVCRKESAWDALYRCAKEHPGELRLITLGPLTNIAAAFMKYPELSGLLHSITVKGGAATFGDVTPAAEFNIYADPHAADIVFRAGAKLNVLFREATLALCFREEDIAGLEKAGSAKLNTLCSLLRSALCADENGVPVGDTAPLMYLVHPEFFTLDDVGVAIETRGSITNGRTVTDAYSDKQFPFKNAIVALGVDKEAFLSSLKEALCAL